MYDRGPQLQAVFIFLLVLCVVTVALRCYTMAFIVKRLGVEDWLAIVALVRSPKRTSPPTYLALRVAFDALF